ncbi:hypothetical protein Tco_0499641, partial [Tanacetum coccineum]
EKVSTDRPIVSTDGSKVSTDRQIKGTDEHNEGTEEHIEGTEEHIEGTEEHNEGTEEHIEGTKEQIKSTDGQRKGTKDHTEEGSATQATQTPTSTIFGDDEIIAKVLLNMSQAKAVSREKEKGNFKHSELKTKKFEEIQALFEKIKRSDEDFISIGSAEDERLIKKMNEKRIDSSKNEMIKEESKEEVKEESKEEESNRKRKLGLEYSGVGSYLVLSVHTLVTEAGTSHSYACREEVSFEEERRKIDDIDQDPDIIRDRLAELINQRKRYFAQQRDEERRNKPLTQAQQRTYMLNYIKHMGSHTLQQLKRYSFNELKALFETTMRRVSTFVPIESKDDKAVLKLAVESSKRDAEEEFDQGSSKRQKTGESIRDTDADELSQEEL